MKKISLLVLSLTIVISPVLCQDYTVGTRNEDGFANAYKSITIGSGYNTKTETRYGLINSNGKFILPLIYKTVFNAGEPGIYEVKDTMDKMALYNALLQQFITDAVFFDIDRFSEGLAVVKKRVELSFKWGAVDTKGNIVIPVEYEYLGALKEGLMNFKKESKMGYMDRNMKVLIPESYYNYADFSNGLAAITPVEAGKMGYIDKNNKVVIPVKYEDAGTFYKGYAAVALKKSKTVGGAGKPTITYPGEMMLINKEGKELTPSPYHYISYYNDGGLFVVTIDKKKGVIDSTGKLILPVEYKDASTDYNGNMIFRTQDDKYGMINNKGELIMKAEYDYIAAALHDKMYYRQKGKYAIMDKNRKLIIPADSAATIARGKNRILFIYADKVKVFDNSGKLLKTFFEGSIKTYATNFAANEDSLKISYDAGVEIINTATGAKKQLPCTEAGDFNEEGIFIARHNKLFTYDFYDHTGKKLNTTGYSTAINFSEGICGLQENSSSTPYLADKTFKKIKDLVTVFKGPYSEGLAASVNNTYPSRVVYLDKQGNEAVSIYGKDGGKCINGRMLISDGSWYYYYNRKGEKLGTKQWEELADYSEGLAAAKSGAKWGFIDTMGTVVIPLQFDQVGSFTKGTAVVKSNGKFKLINKKGESIDNNLYEGAGNPANGTFPLMKGDKVGLVDNKGTVIIGFNYKNIKPMSEDRVWAMQDGKWGLLDNKGNALTGFIYKDVADFDKGYAKVKMSDKIGLINKAGKVILAADYSGLGSVYKNTMVGIKPAGVVMYSLK